MAETILTSGDLLPVLIGISDQSFWKGRKPATPVWQQGVEPSVRVWAAKGQDFQQQFRVDQRGVFIYGEICGMDAFSEGSWSWNDGEGESGSGSLAVYYTFVTTEGEGEDPDTHEVVVNDVVTGDGFISPSPVGLHTNRPEGGIYTVIETNGSGDDYEKTVGTLTLRNPVTQGTLSSYTSQWKTQTAAFRDGTKTGELFAWKSGTDKGWWATVSEGHARHIADVSDDEGGYTGWGGAQAVGIVFERRKNKPVVYDEGDYGSSGNDIYRTGSARWIMNQEILDDPYRDQYGTYGYATAPQRTAAFNKAPWITSPNGLITGGISGVPQYIGRNQLVSADGLTYRVTAEAGDGFGEEWEAVATETATVTPEAPGIIEFDRDTIQTTGAGLTRIILIESYNTETSEWETVAVYPASESLVGRDIGVPGIRLFAAYQFRNGVRWGHEAFDGSDRRFKYKRLIKVASL